MGLFDKFKKKDNTILSPVSGMLIPASEISDPVFSEEMMGQTIGFIPDDGYIVCPVDGMVEVAFPTGHAFGIKGVDGNGYLVHIGIDTVSLEGKGFNALLKQGEKVKAGQPAVEMDINLVKETGLNTTTILIITEKVKDVHYIDFKHVNKGDKINK
ncbi:MAG: PTS glucose transporter subunit IIA [Firmicutes bacterium]|nr:PTS glucose transporter subunit IIA [Bacillota bacterium]